MFKFSTFLAILAVCIFSLAVTKAKVEEQTTPYITMTSNGFRGVSIEDLAQESSFYKKHREVTLTYLAAVYPTAVDTLKELSELELASFYNSLWIYYNCKGQYQDDDLACFQNADGSCVPDSTKWDPLPCAEKYPLPYTAQGHLYNFYTYQKYNIPEVVSDSDDSKSYLKVENASSNRAGFV